MNVGCLGSLAPRSSVKWCQVVTALISDLASLFGCCAGTSLVDESIDSPKISRGFRRWRLGLSESQQPRPAAGIPDATTAITIVAMGTSLSEPRLSKKKWLLLQSRHIMVQLLRPDTFASMTSASKDDTAASWRCKEVTFFSFGGVEHPFKLQSFVAF